MDLAHVTDALNELYSRCRHLPRASGLAQVVLDAWVGAPTGPIPGLPDGPMGAVVRATWPIGAKAGAQRGHRVAGDAIRAIVADALRQPLDDPRAKWIIWSVADAVDNLPAEPDTREVLDRADGRYLWAVEADDLDIALAVGLDNGWRAGHRDATQRLVDQFAEHVTDLVGAQTLTATFLNAYITGDDVVAGIQIAAYHAAERDQENPPIPAGPGETVRRAFPPLSYLGRHRAIGGTPPLPGPERGPTSSR